MRALTHDNQGQRRKERHALLEKVASSVSSSSGHDTDSGGRRPTPPSLVNEHRPDMDFNRTDAPSSLFSPLLVIAADRAKSPLRQMSPSPESLSALFPDVALSAQMPSPNEAVSRHSTDLFVDPTSLFFDTSGSSSGSLPNSSLDLWDQPLSLSAFLQVDDVSNASFADDRWMQVTELDLLRAAYTNATRIKSADRLWDLSAASVFTTQPASGWIEELPDNLRPTSTQLSQPHHPSIDVLPWPSVRDKLIKMWNMPEDFWPRHPVDQERLTLIRFVFDMENGGVRIWGAEADAHEGWEVDQSLVDVWWWALDQSVITNSNRRRMDRGLPRLQLKSPAGLMSLGT